MPKTAQIANVKAQKIIVFNFFSLVSKVGATNQDCKMV